jgi:tRNA pseudouridine32 synthase/23S rRNA pseudouridine746 synthase
MMSIGFPIVGDPFYPTIQERESSDPPMQLLANRLEFIDPLNGEQRSFASSRSLIAS